MGVIDLFKNAIDMSISSVDNTEKQRLIDIFDTDVSVEEDDDYLYIRPKVIGSNRLRRLLGDPAKYNAIFEGFNPFEYKIHKFFKFEIIKILEHLLNGRGAKIDINVPKAKEVLKLLNPPIDYEKLPDIDRDHIEDTFNVKILPHQEEVIKKYLEFKHIFGYRGMLLHGSVGVGKTLTSLIIMEGLHKEIDKVIIICPLQTVSKVWESEISNRYKNTPYYISLARTTKYQNEKYIICHYEALDKLMNILSNIEGRVGIIIDESHNLNDPKSKRTQLALDVVRSLETDNVILMSGTPIKSGFRELSIIFKFLDKRFTPTVESSFIKVYQSTNSFLKETLKERYNGYTAIVKKDVLNLNPVTTVNLKVDLDKKDLKRFFLSSIKEDLKVYIEKRYKELEDEKDYWESEFFRLLEKAREKNPKLQSTVIYENYLRKVNILHDRRVYFDVADLIVEVNKFEKNEILPYLEGEDKKIFRSAKTIYKYPLFKIQGEALANVIGKARIECHKLLAEKLAYPKILESTEKKTIIFSNYIDVCQMVMDKVKEYKYKPIGVFGEETKNLNQAVQSFTKDKNINPLVTTYKSLSTGVPLTAADTIICVDLPFRMYIYEQAIGRAWRLGQDSNVVVYILELNTNEPNINSRNIDIIQFFKEEVEKITGIPASLDIINSENNNELASIGLEDDIHLNISTEDDVKIVKSPNRIKAEEFILKYIDKIVSGKKNTILYRDLFNSMTNEEFDRFMTGIRDGDINLSIVVPHGDPDIKCKVENNYKIANELGVNFFQKLKIGENGDLPAYKTTNDYMIMKIPIRRAAQLLSKKISLSDHDNKIDPLTGQVISESRSAKLSYPELQVLMGQGFDLSLRELMKVRGGDIGISKVLSNILYNKGQVSQRELESFSTNVQSTKTLKIYLNGAHIKNTL